MLNFKNEECIKLINEAINHLNLTEKNIIKEISKNLSSEHELINNRVLDFSEKSKGGLFFH